MEGLLWFTTFLAGILFVIMSYFLLNCNNYFNTLEFYFSFVNVFKIFFFLDLFFFYYFLNTILLFINLYVYIYIYILILILFFYYFYFIKK